MQIASAVGDRIVCTCVCRAAFGHKVHGSIAGRADCVEREAAIRAGLRLGDLCGDVCAGCPTGNCRSDDRLTCEENLTFQFMLCGRTRFWDHDGGAERDNEPELSSELHRRSSCLLARRPRAEVTIPNAFERSGAALTVKIFNRSGIGATSSIKPHDRLGSFATGSSQPQIRTSALTPKPDSSRTSGQVRFVPILLQKSFLDDERKFLEPLMRLRAAT